MIVPSLPGYPGATGHTELDTHLDWVLAVRQLIDKAGLAGADLLGASVGGAFAAEMAAIFPGHVRKLVLIAPFGLFDDKEPAADPWAQRKDNVAGLMCADGAKWRCTGRAARGRQFDRMADRDEPRLRGRGAAPSGRSATPRLEKRLGLIAAPTLILWGERDAVLPPSYAKKFAAGINGSTRVETVAGAGHLAYLDQPDAVARAVLAHFA